MDLSIIIPVFNEREKIGKDVEAAVAFLKAHDFSGEVIVVDDGSSDGTPDLVNTLLPPSDIPVKIIRYAHRGKGFTLRNGVINGQGDYIMYTDSGGCVPFENILPGMVMLKEGRCDLAHGSRRLNESKILRPHSWHRRILSRIFRWFMISWMRIPGELTDTQCGFKIYTGNVARDLFGTCISNGFMFEVEIIIRAMRRGFRIKEFPVEWMADRDSRLRLWKNLPQGWLELVRIRKVLRGQK